MLGHIPTYYVLAFLSGEKWTGAAAARRELERLSGHMALCLRDYLYMAALGEARHGMKRIGIGFKGFESRERSSIFSESVKYGPTEDNLGTLCSLFEDNNWGGSYGGKPWGGIVRLTMKYGTMNDILYVDTVVNAKHNGGLAFNKHEAANYMQFDFSFNGQALAEFLDYRQRSPNILLGAGNVYFKLGLTCGRMANSFIIECNGNANPMMSLRSLPDGSYTPVQWKNKPHPKFTERSSILCGVCGYNLGDDEDDDVVKCNNCGKKLCEDCSVWSDDHDGHYCSSCLDMLNEDEEKEDDEGNVIVGPSNGVHTCDVCMEGIVTKHLLMECGDHVHNKCKTHHAKSCQLCFEEYHPGIDLMGEVKYGMVEIVNPNDTPICAFCDKPIEGPNWKSADHSPVHAHCFWLIPGNKAWEADYYISKGIFDKSLELCTNCGMPHTKSGMFHVDGSTTMCPVCYYHSIYASGGNLGCNCPSCQSILKKSDALYTLFKDKPKETNVKAKEQKENDGS